MKKQSILRGALLLTGADLLMRLMGIGFHAFLVQKIGANGLGLMQLIASVGLFAIIAGTSGIRVSAMCLTAEEFGSQRPQGAYSAVNCCLRWGLAVSVTVGALFFLLAPALSERLPIGGREALLSLRIIAIFLPFSCLCGVMSGYFTACGRIRRLAAVQIAERSFSMGLTTLLLLGGAGDNHAHACAAIFLGSGIGAALEFSFLYFSFRRGNRHFRRLPRKKLPPMRKRLRRLCIPLALNDYLRAGLNTAEQLLIPYGLSMGGLSGTGALAAHGTIHAMVFPVLMFPAAILYAVSDLLVPELSRSRAMGQTGRIRDLSDKCLRLTWLFACGAGGFLFCCADPLGMQIYSSADAGQYLRIFAPMVLMLYLDAITDGMLKGLCQQLSCVRYNTLTSFLDILLLFLLLPRWGIVGYIFSFALTHGINLLLSLRRLLKVTGYWLKIHGLLRGALCLCLALPAALCLPESDIPLRDILCRGGFFLSVLSSLYLFSGAFSPQDLRWLKQVFHTAKASK